MPLAYLSSVLHSAVPGSERAELDSREARGIRHRQTGDRRVSPTRPAFDQYKLEVGEEFLLRTDPAADSLFVLPGSINVGKHARVIDDKILNLLRPGPEEVPHRLPPL